MLNRKTFFVSFFLRRDRVMKNGTAPIMARISVNGIAKEIYTQCRTAVDKWDPAKGRATGRDRLSYEVNAYIDDFRAKVIEIYRTLQAEGFEGNAIEIKERLKSPGKQVRMLLAELMLYCEKRQKEVGVRITQLTSNKYYRLCRYLHEYTRLEYKKEDIRLTEVTYGYLDGFNTFLQTAHRCHHNGAINILDCLRNFILYCLRNEWIEKNPFKNYKLKEVAPPPKEHLTKKEIEMLIAKPMPNLRLGNVRDIFVFCCFTGLSYVDVKRLYPSHIETTLDGRKYIRINRKKTDVESFIPLHPIAEQILAMYNTTDESNPIFPLPKRDMLWYCIHEIGIVAGIKENLSYHASRHSFGTLMLSAGVPIESISKMMGHTSIKTTQGYAKVTDDKISEDMDKLIKRRQEQKNNPGQSSVPSAVHRS